LDLKPAVNVNPFTAKQVYEIILSYTGSFNQSVVWS